MEINKVIMEDHDMQEFKKDTSASDISQKENSYQGSASKDTFCCDSTKVAQLKQTI